MAGETAIAAIIQMALTYCRRHERHEVDAAIRMWSTTFEHTDTDALRDAVIRWAETLDEDAIRAQTLPLPQTLKRIMGEGREKIDDQAAPRPWTPVRPEFAAAHKDARRKIIAMSGGVGQSLEEVLRAKVKPRPIKHNHTEPTYDPGGELVTMGNEECRACNAEELERRDAEERRAKVNALLATLPDPVDDEEDRRTWSGCRCDGSGMIDTKASVAAIHGDDLPREVYPCPKCNADLFGRWQRGDLRKAS